MDAGVVVEMYRLCWQWHVWSRVDWLGEYRGKLKSEVEGKASRCLNLGSGSHVVRFVSLCYHCLSCCRAGSLLLVLYPYGLAECLHAVVSSFNICLLTD